MCSKQNGLHPTKSFFKRLLVDKVTSMMIVPFGLSRMKYMHYSPNTSLLVAYNIMRKGHKIQKAQPG